MDIKDIEEIVRILKQSDISDFELEQNGIKIKLARGSNGAMQQSVAMTVPMQPAITNVAPVANNDAQAGKEDLSRFSKVESPIVGTFYRKPSPDAEVFVNVGDVVKKDQTLCIIEAMKLMNEIPSPVSGKVERILLNDGEVAEFGEVLFLITPS